MFFGFFPMLDNKEDPCADVTCLNGGSCSNLEGGDFLCVCLEGYQGKYCEECK